MNVPEQKNTSRHDRRPVDTHTTTPERVQAETWQQWRDEANLPLLPDENPVSTVRDSLYDLIPLGPRELKIISSEPFLRLQQVKQLGFVYRIWPGATHTRYEHSLGSYHLATRALRALLQRGSTAAHLDYRVTLPLDKRGQ